MSEIVKTISTSDARRLVLEGIEGAKGSSKALSFLMGNDLILLGRTLAVYEEYYNAMFSIEVEPVISIQGSLFESDSIDLNELPLDGSVAGKKKVYFMPVYSIEDRRNVDIFLNRFGKKPLINTTEYFLGAMLYLRGENKLPESLEDKEFVAFSSTETVIFSDTDGDPCFLSGVNLVDKVKLSLTYTEALFDVAKLVVLAEDL